MLCLLAFITLGSAQFCGCGMRPFGGCGYGCGMPMWGGYGGCGGRWPFGAMGGGGGGQMAGYGQNTMANAYGAGNNNCQYGQGTGAVNTNNAACNVNAMQRGGVNNYSCRNANQVLVNSINDNCMSGTNSYNGANINAIAGNNNMYGAGTYGNANNNYANAAGMGACNNGGYTSTGGAGGGMWGF